MRSPGTTTTRGTRRRLARVTKRLSWLDAPDAAATRQAGLQAARRAELDAALAAVRDAERKLAAEQSD